MAAGWATGVIDAVGRWIAVRGGPSRAAVWSDLGVATVRDDGRLSLDLRGGRVPEVFVDACLAGGGGPECEPGHPVEELRNEDGVLVLRGPAGLPEDLRHVWVRAPSPRFLVERLLHGLRTAGPAPLAQALAEQRLAGSPTSGADAPGLAGAQLDAFRSCLSPGVRLVRAAAGAGGAEVFARAVEELVRQDQRVLLVSASDAAVDDALLAAVRRMEPPPGLAVRVGAAQRAEIAGDPGVQVERLAAGASREVDAQRAAVAARLREVDEADAEVVRLRAELAGFDEPAYRAAAARLAAERDAEQLHPRLQEAEADANRVRRAALTAATELQEALAASAELDPLRDALADEAAALAGLAVLDERLRVLQQERAALDEREPQGWLARRQHRREVDAADAAVRRFSDAAAAGRRRWLDVQLQARAVIGERSQADVDAADLRVAAAEAAVAAADEEYRHSRDVLAGLRRAIDEAEAQERPSDDDRRLVADSEARGLPARHARLQELADQGTGRRRRSLEAELRTLAGRARLLRADAEVRLVREARVVATTLARSRTHPALARAAFDVVLVDDAGAAPLAEVLLALCRATTTAVLVGDVLDRAPVLDGGIADHPSPAVQRWVRGTCFSHLGISTAADAAARDGCVVLDQPSRPETHLVAAQQQA